MSPPLRWAWRGVSVSPWGTVRRNMAVTASATVKTYNARFPKLPAPVSRDSPAQHSRYF